MAEIIKIAKVRSQAGGLSYDATFWDNGKVDLQRAGGQLSGMTKTRPASYVEGFEIRDRTGKWVPIKPLLLRIADRS